MNKDKLSDENEDLRVRMREGDKLLATCQDELDHYREKVSFFCTNFTGLTSPLFLNKLIGYINGYKLQLKGQDELDHYRKIYKL